MLNILVPSFLKRLDHYLLLHYRLLWISKIHYVLFYSALTLVLGGVLIYTYPLTSASDLPEMSVVLLIVIGLVAPACVYWVYWQTVYGVESDFGLRFRGIAYLRFALQFLCFGILGSLTLALTFLVEHRIVNLASEEELVNDLNILNIGNPYMPSRTEGDTLWNDCRFYQKRVKSSDTDDSLNQSVTLYTLNLIIIGRDTVKAFTMYNNFVYFIPYIFIDGELIINGESIGKREYFKKILSPEDNLNLFFKKPSKKIMLNAVKQYIDAFNKYSEVKIKGNPKDFLESYLAKKVMLGNDVNKGNVKAKIEYLYLKKVNPYIEGGFQGRWFAWVPFSFLLSIFLFNFHYVSKKEFIIGVLGVVGIIFLAVYSSGFIEEWTREIEDVDAGLQPLIIALVLSAVFAVLMGFCVKNYYQARQRSKLKNIILLITNIIGFCTLMMFFFTIVNSHLRNYSEIDEVTRAMHRFYELIYLYSFLSPYFFIFVPLFHQFFVKMRSLPR